MSYIILTIFPGKFLNTTIPITTAPLDEVLVKLFAALLTAFQVLVPEIVIFKIIF